MKKLLSLLLLCACLFSSAASAAPTSGQVDFISRMSQNGYVVEQGGYVFYAHKEAIWRMNVTGKGQKKQYVMNAPFDLQNHGGNVYFIDKKGEAYTLYRFLPGDKKPVKLLENVFDAVIGGDILYYVNKKGDSLRAWDLVTGKTHTLYKGKFTGARELNYLEKVLAFTAENEEKQTCMYLYSPETNNATFYRGMAAGDLLAQGSFFYMPFDGAITRVNVDPTQPYATRGRAMLAGAERFIIAGTSFYYWKEQGKQAQIIKRGISTGTETQHFTYDTTKYRNVTLHPTAAAIWVFTEDRAGCYYKERISR